MIGGSWRPKRRALGDSGAVCRWLRRRATAVGLAGVALLLGGCVYLRLLQLKRQLADFDANFTVQVTSGLRLNCLHPVVLADDLRFLGFYPARTRKLGAAEQWTIRWLKEPPPNAREKQRYEIGFDLYFARRNSMPCTSTISISPSCPRT
jgi:hypothetical protein